MINVQISVIHATTIIMIGTVEPPITDPPTRGQLLYKGH